MGKFPVQLLVIDMPLSNSLFHLDCATCRINNEDLPTASACGVEHLHVHNMRREVAEVGVSPVKQAATSVLHALLSWRPALKHTQITALRAARFEWPCQPFSLPVAAVSLSDM